MSQKTFSLVPGFQGGMFTPAELEESLTIIRKYNVQATKLTSAQRLGLLGIPKEELPGIARELQAGSPVATDNGITYVQSCPGENWANSVSEMCSPWLNVLSCSPFKYLLPPRSRSASPAAEYAVPNPISGI